MPWAGSACHLGCVGLGRFSLHKGWQARVVSFIIVRKMVLWKRKYHYIHKSLHIFQSAWWRKAEAAARQPVKCNCIPRPLYAWTISYAGRAAVCQSAYRASCTFKLKYAFSILFLIVSSKVFTVSEFNSAVVTFCSEVDHVSGLIIIPVENSFLPLSWVTLQMIGRVPFLLILYFWIKNKIFMLRCLKCG